MKTGETKSLLDTYRLDAESMRYIITKDMDTQLPISGQGLKMLIDGCTNCGTFQSIPVEDLYQEGIDEMKDKIRWVPTDHMLVDCMTKRCPRL